MNIDTLRSTFRAAMPVARRWAYFDHAAVAPLPQPTHDAMAQWLREATEEGDTAWPRWSEGVHQARQWGARLIHAQPDEIALIPNTTTGISLVAEGFPWQPGDNIVTLANEFPSNIYPWMNLARRGVTLRRVPAPHGLPDRAALREACDGRTRMITLSWVGFASGWRWDLAEAVDLARQCGALLMVDAIQGLGVHPIDVSALEIDFLAADGHKWLLGPEGAGLLYVRACHLDRLGTPFIGWNSMVQRYAFDHIAWQPRPAASRFEGGTYPMANLLGFAASLRWLQEIGLTPTSSPVETSVLDFRAEAAELIVRRGGTILNAIPDRSHQSGILCFDLPQVAPEVIRDAFRAAGVVVSCRGGGIRLSPHGYANTDDLDRLDHAFQTLLPLGPPSPPAVGG